VLYFADNLYIDNISTYFLRIASIILPYLAGLFSYAIEFAIYPDYFKLAKVKPIYKAGPESNLSNYRPISLLPIISKIFKNVISTRLIQFFEKHNIIYTRQFGFRKIVQPLTSLLT